jgi:hypothetical protein
MLLRNIMMRVGCRLCVAAMVASLVTGSAECTRVFAQGYGTITGQFVLDGELPPLVPIVKKGDTSVRDYEVCAKDNIFDESLVVDAKTKGIANIFFFMPKKPGNIHPDLKESKEKLVKFDQKGCRFIPRAMVLRTDQTVAVLSGDPIIHNTHVNTIRNDGKNQTISPDDREGKVQWEFKLPEKYVTKVNCDIHSFMLAWWLIIDHPYAAVTGPDGRFKIEKVPAGEQEFVAWQEAGWLFGKSPQARVRKFAIKANETTDIGVVKIPVSMFGKK